MMKLHSKLTIVFVIAFAGCFLSLDSRLHAQSTTTGTSTITEKGEMQARFCERIIGNIEKLALKVGERDSKLQALRVERQTKLDARIKTRTEKLAGQRSEWDKRRTEGYLNLEAKVKTDAERAAVLAFKQRIEAAVLARRAAVDAAILAYQDGLKSAIESRKTAVDSTVPVFKNAVLAASDKAKADCSAGGSAKSVRETMVKSLKAAREKLSEDKKSVESLKVSVMTLSEARKSAFQKAIASFKSEAEAAKSELREVVRPASSSASSSVSSTSR